MRLRADRREERQKEAAERVEHWRSLSTSEQIESLKRRSGESKRQMRRLAGGQHV